MARNKFDIDETLEKDSEFNLVHLLRLRKYMAPYQKKLLSTAAIMFASSILGLAGPFFMKVAIDSALPPGNRDIPLLIALSSALFVANAANILFIRHKVKSMSQVGQGIIRDLRADLFAHLQELPFRYYDSRPHGKILVRVVNYINSLSDMLSNGIINLATDLFSLLLIVFAMLALNVKLAVASLAGLPLLLVATFIIKVNQRKAWRLNSAKQSNMNAYIHESIAGVKITQSFAREAVNKGIFSNVAKSVKASWLKACSIQFLMWPSAENISVWSMALLYVCGVRWMVSDAAVTVGVLVAFIGYIGRFWGPINNIANFYNSIVVNMTYLERIFEAIDEPVDVKDAENAADLPSIKGEVSFSHVTFGYEPGMPILKDVSFLCRAGETIALVGPTGAGKSTIISLISRFYDLDSGKVCLDGVDIKGVKLKSLRSQLGIMLQDSFIFSGTIYDNIRYSRLDASNEEIIEAAKTVCAHDFIMEMEKGYDTEVNERGSRLSAGQRQLISFARALLADPKILILDEATASIDTKTEKALQKGLDRMLSGRTSFIIAHRLSTIKNASRIMYIDKGAILESGTHDELMSIKGAYYSLHTAQYVFMETKPEYRIPALQV
ncbi:MAG: ABC transporter ATP-binding protein/permease [Clostridiales bacterium]|jgi:ATP-binding cassette subfamily B protein|nr:ABC transporter ATP-binding protein/permease [Clostridiales bacterium]